MMTMLHKNYKVGQRGAYVRTTLLIRFIITDCIIGTVTEKVRKFISSEAEKAAKEKAESSKNKEAVLLKHRFVASLH